jgi:hypothetical protein
MATPKFSTKSPTIRRIRQSPRLIHHSSNPVNTHLLNTDTDLL